MNRILLLTAAAVLGAGCIVKQGPPQDPCDPNPCTEANRNVCTAEAGEAVCACNAGFLTRPNGACEAVTEANCPTHPGDTAEPDECMAKAVALPFGSEAAVRSIDPVGDYDFFTFDGVAGRVYQAHVTVTDGALYPRLDLFDQTGLQVAFHEAPAEALLRVKLYATAGYYLRVMHSPLDPSVATGGYRIALTDLGQEDHGDGPDTATALAAEDASATEYTTHSGSFEFDLDQDWFEISAASQDVFRITFDASAPLPWVSLWTDPDAEAPEWTVQQQVIDFDVSGGGTAWLALYPPEGGTGGYAFTFVK